MFSLFYKRHNSFHREREDKQFYEQKKMSGVEITTRESMITENEADAAQKLKFCIKDLFRKCDQILSNLRILSYLVRKSLMENLIFLRSVKLVTAG